MNRDIECKLMLKEAIELKQEYEYHKSINSGGSQFFPLKTVNGILQF